MKDKGVRKRPNEFDALKNANVRAFVLLAGNASAQQGTDAVLAALPRIRRIVDRYEAPFVYGITAGGDVKEIEKSLRPSRATRTKRVTR